MIRPYTWRPHPFPASAGWKNVYDEKPAVGQIVEVVFGIKRIVLAVYDPKWEHSFCNTRQTESLSSMPILWRATNRLPQHTVIEPDVVLAV
jgi:hypothetical protein